MEARRYEIGIEGQRVVERFLGAQMTLDLKHMEDPWTEDHLVAWVVAHVEDANASDRQDITHLALKDFVRRAVHHLTRDRALTLADLQRYAFCLHKAIDQKIRRHRDTAFQRGFQQLLALPAADVSTSFDYAFAFPAEGYQPHWYYEGSFRFARHFYPEVGELDSKGEEFDCAVALDQCPQVEFWVRNLDHGPSAYSLPVPTGRFFPDFAAKLADDRVMLVEYKGALLEGKASEQTKRDVGLFWQERSAGKALFLWALRQDAEGRSVLEQLKAKIANASCR